MAEFTAIIETTDIRMNSSGDRAEGGSSIAVRKWIGTCEYCQGEVHERAVYRFFSVEEGSKPETSEFPSVDVRFSKETDSVRTVHNCEDWA